MCLFSTDDCWQDIETDCYHMYASNRSDMSVSILDNAYRYSQILGSQSTCKNSRYVRTILTCMYMETQLMWPVVLKDKLKECPLKCDNVCRNTHNSLVVYHSPVTGCIDMM